jgi:hypothetical protein
MAIIIATSISIAVLFGFAIEWSQRKCENWAYLRDKDR